MLDSLRAVIDAVFSHVSPDSYLEQINKRTMSSDGRGYKYNYKNFDMEELRLILRARLPHYSEDEVVNLYKHIANEESSLYTYESYRSANKINVFELVLRFAYKALVINNGEILCEYSQLLRWRTLSHLLGEELFTTAFSAHYDSFHNYSRKDFAWNIILKTNNLRLRNLLAKGMCENHFHLYGSAPVYQLSWVRLMNHMTDERFIQDEDIRSKIQALDRETLMPKTIYNDAASSSLFYLCQKACIIRFYLYTRMIESTENKEIDIVDIDVDFNQIKSRMDHIAISEVYIDVRKYNKYVREASYGLSNYARFLDMHQSFCVYEYDGYSQAKREAIRDLLHGLLHTDDMLDASEPYLSLGSFLRRLPRTQYALKITKLRALLQPEFYKSIRLQRQKEIVLKILNDNKEMKARLSEIFKTMKNYMWNEFRDLDIPVVDYAIPHSQYGRKAPNIFLYGERKFLYDAFQTIFKTQEQDTLFGDLLYIYNIISIRFRAELIQVNSNVGFSNFAHYQDRKVKFIDSDRQFIRAAIHMAVNDAFQEQGVLALEMRVTPKNTVAELAHSITETDNVLKSDDVWQRKERRTESEKWFAKNDENFNKKSMFNTVHKYNNAYNNSFYVLHFSKRKDEIDYLDNNNESSKYIYPRHYHLRNLIEVQANALVALRNSEPDIAKRIYGIDACSSELYCRPEVFATVFRYLSNHIPRPNAFREQTDKCGKLNMTYHVGEDFFDVIGGLRAIEECIYFLNMGQGSRLGHALALGVNVIQWYRSKSHRIKLTKHDLLDDFAWMHAKIRKYNIGNCAGFALELEKRFSALFMEIYRDSKLDNIKSYYDAWKLRGDDPSCYFEKLPAELEAILKCPVGEWEYYRINRIYPNNQRIRENEQVRELYYLYHYDSVVKKIGAQSIEYPISDDHVRITAEIQARTKELVNRLHISIECNPSSNVKIGIFERYSEHPIINWFSGALGDSEISKQEQLHVSINTDDQGVFNTCLENEYALMAISLEKEKRANGTNKYSQTQIYEWLDQVRKMGLEQSFRLASYSTSV